jgi:hypothetical protein
MTVINRTQAAKAMMLPTIREEGPSAVNRAAIKLIDSLSTAMNRIGMLGNADGEEFMLRYTPIKTNYEVAIGQARDLLASPFDAQTQAKLSAAKQHLSALNTQYTLLSRGFVEPSLAETLSSEEMNLTLVTGKLNDLQRTLDLATITIARIGKRESNLEITPALIKYASDMLVVSVCETVVAIKALSLSEQTASSTILSFLQTVEGLPQELGIPSVAGLIAKVQKNRTKIDTILGLCSDDFANGALNLLMQSPTLQNVALLKAKLAPVRKALDSDYNSARKKELEIGYFILMEHIAIVEISLRASSSEKAFQCLDALLKKEVHFINGPDAETRAFRFQLQEIRRLAEEISTINRSRPFAPTEADDTRYASKIETWINKLATASTADRTLLRNAFANELAEATANLEAIRDSGYGRRFVRWIQSILASIAAFFGRNRNQA